MSRREKILLKILRGTSDGNISFDEIRILLKYLEFDERIKGSHHIFTRSDVQEILNLQPKRGKAKSYQVKQVRNAILKYKLADGSNNE